MESTRGRQQAALVEFGQRALREPDISAVCEHAEATVAAVLGADGCRVRRHDADQRPPPGDGAAVSIGALIDGPDGRPYGTIEAYRRTPPPFTSDDAMFVQSVAQMIAALMARCSAEDQLLQAQKMQAVGQLAGGMAHDFNNLLTAILGYAELLIPDVADNARAADSLLQLRDAGRQAAGLAEQLLTFSRGQVPERTAVDVNEIVTCAEQMLSGVLGDDVAVHTELATVGFVEANPAQIEQLLVNLALNAREAMPLGGALRISTSALRLDSAGAPLHGVDPGTYVKLCCADSGTGMDDLTLKRVFEPFFTTRTERQATGLGLATVYAVARNAGGHVRIDSRPGDGTTVTVLLPVSSGAGTRAVAQADRTAPLTGSETILLVEDQATVRALLGTVLEQHGYSVVVAADGQEGLGVLSTRRDIDLLVTDVVMPQLNGPDLVQLIARTAPNLRVLYVSGYADCPSLPTTGGASAFLHKPFGVSEFMGKVRELLDHEIVTRQLA